MKDTQHLREQTARRLQRRGVIAVIRASTSTQAVELCEALFEGGIRCLEVTLSVPNATDAIAKLSRSCPEALLGAGSVLDPTMAQRCLVAGARFVVSPAVLPELVPVAHRHGAVAILGALTPTEVLAAHQASADFVKLYPVSSLGGPQYVSALRAPLPQIKYAPSGGVELDTLGAYVAAGATLVAVGGALADAELLQRDGRDAVVQLARQYVEAWRLARESQP